MSSEEDLNRFLAEVTDEEVYAAIKKQREDSIAATVAELREELERDVDGFLYRLAEEEWERW